MAGSSEKISFEGADGDMLAARLDLPDGPPKAYALWAHCFSCTKDIFAASRVAAGLTEKGFAVLRFDFTGLGASEGDFANTNFSSNVADLVAAADWLRDNHDAPDVLIGHSLGGAAVLAGAHKVPEAKAVCTIAAPADPGHVAHLFQDSREESEAAGEAEVLLAGRPFRIKKQFLEDIEKQTLDGHIADLRKALLILHAPLDDTVSIDNAGAIFTAAKHPKSFVSLDDADHLLRRKVDANYVADLIASWAARYIDLTDDDTPALSAAPGTVVVAETGEGKFTNDIAIGDRHLLRADEPESFGGGDSGPSPYELLMSALGACKTMTMRMYADRKGYALDRAKVTLSHSKIHAADCEDCETKEGKIDQIEVSIDVSGDMDDETRQSVMAIAERCPVHRTLQSEVRIATTYSD